MNILWTPSSIAFPDGHFALHKCRPSCLSYQGLKFTYPLFTPIPQVLQAVAKCVHLGYTSSTVYLNVLPLFHVGGISSTLAVTMVAGCHVFLPRFTPASGNAAVQAGGVNTLVAVPTMLHMLVKEAYGRSSVPDKVASLTTGTSPLGAVTRVVIGGQTMSHSLESLARDCMPKAVFVQTYACTEAGSTISFAVSSPSSSLPSKETYTTGLAGSLDGMFASRDATNEREQTLRSAGGSSAEHVEIRVVERGLPDSRSVRCAAPGVVGEVETRGPHVMKGYWGRPELTAEVLRPDGWLRTGDLGRLDERTGRLVVVGRANDVIKTGGENVYASEVEGVLLRHHWVAEAAAYGVEDERLGEKVAVSVVLDDAARDQAGAVSCDRARTVLKCFCGLHLSHYKRPRRIDVVPALPRNSVGKVMRHRLRASL